jgi:signal peptidase I
VEGDSMLPTFESGDVLLTWPILGSIKQGQMVVFVDPSLGDRAIKRVAGLPGQTPSNRHQGNSTELKTHTVEWGYTDSDRQGLAPRHYFLIGDNPSVSIDSRQFGAISRDHIDRRVLGRIWPFRRHGAGRG